MLGSRLDVRQTGSRVIEFKGDRKIIHVDCDPGEINNRVLGCDPVVANLSTFLPALAANAEAWPRCDWSEWRTRIETLRRYWPDSAEQPNPKGICPNVLMHLVSRVSAAAAAFVVDVGQHQMWAAQSLELLPHQRFLTSGGMGSMGFALPAAIGAALAAAGRPVVVIAGDGGF